MKTFYFTSTGNSLYVAKKIGQFCLACVHHCPQNAVRVKGEKSRKRFKNENVSLSEILEANN